jgi:hypothetical protein
MVRNGQAIHSSPATVVGDNGRDSAGVIFKSEGLLHGPEEGFLSLAHDVTDLK